MSTIWGFGSAGGTVTRGRRIKRSEPRSQVPSLVHPWRQTELWLWGSVHRMQPPLPSSLEPLRLQETAEKSAPHNKGQSGSMVMAHGCQTGSLALWPPAKVYSLSHPNHPTWQSYKDGPDGELYGAIWKSTQYSWIPERF